jgi:radical SAM protein with 4Fe4S-binding SPASM domain
VFDVVVPTIGRPSLAALLAALAADADALPGQVVLVDDRRRRDRPLLAGPVPAALTGRVVVRVSGGRGPAAARNVGWRGSDAPWIAFVDDDVVPSPGWARQLRADLDAATPQTAAVQGQLRVPLPTDRPPTDWERNVARLDTAVGITADMAIRRAALASVGGFDERFPRAYREDTDLALRLTTLRWTMTVGARRATHPVRPARWWISIRTQTGNADDALMAALHGPGWRTEPWRSRRPRHVATTLAGAVAAGGLLAGSRTAALFGAGAWLAQTAEFAWARIKPGPRDLREVATMIATSAVLPAAATYHWLVGTVRARRLTAQARRAPEGEMEVDVTYTHPVRPPLPRSLQVEVTAACNLACPMCLVRYRPPVNKLAGAMPLETFTALLDDLPGLDDVTLQGLGEPLLSPHLLDMVAAARARGLTVGFNTNATLLTRPKADALVAAGLSWLCISIDGASAATYEGIRDGASLEHAVRNIRGLVAAKAAAGTDAPRLTFVFVAMRRNLHELPDVVRLAADVGVPNVSVQNLSHDFADTAADPAYAAIATFTAGEALWADDAVSAGAVFDEARCVAEELGVHLHLPRLSIDGARRPRSAGEPGCDWPWRAAYVNHDGQVQPCCMVMGADRASFGNALADGFPAVWAGEEASSFRAALLTDSPPDVCAGCSLYHGVF